MIDDSEVQRILVINAHPDDVDFSAAGTIAGWTDGIPQMVVGDKVRFWIPEELAYKGQPNRPQGMLVFASNRTGVFQLYSIRADGSQLGQLTHGKAADTVPLLSPDGRRSLFIRSPKQNVSELWVMNANGSGQRKLAAHGYAPTWSPDSRRIAYVDAPNPPGPLAIKNVESWSSVVVSGRFQ